MVERVLPSDKPTVMVSRRQALLGGDQAEAGQRPLKRLKNKLLVMNWECYFGAQTTVYNDDVYTHFGV
jgi:hypothetical protein